MMDQIDDGGGDNDDGGDDGVGDDDVGIYYKYNLQCHSFFLILVFLHISP